MRPSVEECPEHGPDRVSRTAAPRPGYNPGPFSISVERHPNAQHKETRLGRDQTPIARRQETGLSTGPKPPAEGPAKRQWRQRRQTQTLPGKNGVEVIEGQPLTLGRGLLGLAAGRDIWHLKRCRILNTPA